MPTDSVIHQLLEHQLTTANIRISSALAASAVTPKAARPRPPASQPASQPAKALNRSKYGEATVMRRLPVSVLPAVNRLLTRRLEEAEADDPDVWESRWFFGCSLVPD